jgi:hypothetical protein
MFSVVMDRRIKPERGRLNTNALYYRVAGQVNLYLRRLRFGYVSMCPCVHASDAGQPHGDGRLSWLCRRIYFMGNRLRKPRGGLWRWSRNETMPEALRCSEHGQSPPCSAVTRLVSAWVKLMPQDATTRQRDDNP